MRKPTVELDSDSKVAVIRLQGDRREPEPESVRIVFPGGSAEVVRTTQGDYWVHATSHHPEHGLFVPGETEPSAITNARLDSVNKHTVDMALGDFADPGLYHVAVLVARNRKEP